MKKVICYGINNRKLRQRVNNYLSDQFEVIGYSDSFNIEDNLQGEYFIALDEIAKCESDYILILSEDSMKQQEIKQTLILRGAMAENIVVPRLLYNEEAYFTPNLKKEICENTRNEYNGVILGLSYSLRGIDLGKLKSNFIDFSWHGMDIYYNWVSLEYFLDNYDGIIQVAFLVFPYYYFNYDMSSSFYQFDTAQVLALHGYNDWHNASNSSDDRIRDYLKCFELFGDKFWKQVNWKKYCPKNYKEKDSNYVNLSDIWKSEYKNTKKENYTIMQNILEVLKLKKVRTYIIVPPILNKYINEEDLIFYESNKRYFYYVVNKLKEKYKFDILDYSEIYNFKPQLFYDYEHLNESGRQEFTRILNDLL